MPQPVDPPGLPCKTKPAPARQRGLFRARCVSRCPLRADYSTSIDADRLSVCPRLRGKAFDSGPAIWDFQDIARVRTNRDCDGEKIFLHRPSAQLTGTLHEACRAVNPGPSVTNVGLTPVSSVINAMKQGIGCARNAYHRHRLSKEPVTDRHTDHAGNHRFDSSNNACRRAPGLHVLALVGAGRHPRRTRLG